MISSRKKLFMDENLLSHCNQPVSDRRAQADVRRSIGIKLPVAKNPQDKCYQALVILILDILVWKKKKRFNVQF